ncbi:PBP1A family penicillin-binding protein [Chthonobacter rhizosphaerae]|uniref:PBP1A family penicillin-binding protein n=1 Tax=Chthonobacter rhizosphaerae TaxID=2735553 RepID=UPI0015EE7358
MSDFKSKHRRRPLRQRLLAIDAVIDSVAYSFADRFACAWSAIVDHADRLKVRGARRAAVEVASEAATLGVAGSVLLLAFAVPAFRATETDWRAQGEYAVTFFDKNGALIGRRGMFLDDSVPLDQLPPHLVQATLATEDRRFHEHFGIDVFGTFRALVTNARAGGVVQGGSSITQQLAKNLFLTNERTIERKIKEAYLSLWLEANLTKQEILKLYLDRAYMGGGTHGVAAAAEFYFGKSVKDLTLAESAMLAGLFKAPTKYAPHVNLPAARARANQVLTNMVAAGFATEGQVAAARRHPAAVVGGSRQQAPDWFLDWAFDEVKRIAPTGDRTIMVKTTLDPVIQKAADEAIETSLRQYGQDYNVRQASAVIQEPAGAVRALVGGRDYGESQFNRAAGALRQPGSSFKPFVYAAAFMHGFSASSVVPDAPISIGNWSPRNYSRGYAGPVTLKTALTKSINTVPVRLAQAIGRDKIVDVAHKLGITTELKITRALPLGVAEVTALDMGGAYAAFANGGVKATPYAVTEISTRSGRIVYDRARDEPPPERVLPEEVAFQMNDVLVNVVNAGTGGRARLEGQMAAGKTGTTQAYRDAWFVGYTGHYVGSVWFGNDDYTSTKDMTGGSLPAMTWQSIMAVAHQGLPFKAIPGVETPDAPAKGETPVAAAPATTPATAGVLSPDAVRIVGELGSLMRGRIGVDPLLAPGSGRTTTSFSPVPPATGFQPARLGAAEPAGTPPAVTPVGGLAMAAREALKDTAPSP